MLLSLDRVRIDGGTQPREAINESVVDDYAEDFIRAVKFPPLVVFFDGVVHWLADGFHRYHGARKAAMTEIECDVRQGTRRDAIKFSLSANSLHGLRRTNGDKHRAVSIALGDTEWRQLSDREVADLCGVSHPFVGRIRAEVAPRPSTKKAPPPPWRAPEASDSPPPERIIDGRERVVEDDKAREAFERLPAFSDLVNRVHSLKREILDFAESDVGRHIPAQQLAADMQNVAVAIRFGEPYTTCPHMPNCKTGGCRTCDGKRWVTKRQWDTVPEELKS